MVLKNDLLFLLLFIFLSGNMSAQSSNLTVTELNITGLKKTKEHYLNHFIKVEEGQTVSPESIKEDVQSLKNLFAIADVKTKIDTTNTGLKITYQIEEALTLFPIVAFGSIQDNLWWQVGATDVNLFGQGNQFSGYYLNNDGRHNGSLYYRVPYIGGSRWGGSLSFLKWATIEPTYFPEGEVIYNYDFTSYGLSGIYEFKINHNIEFGGNFFIEEYEKLPEQPLQNPPGPNDLSLPKLLFKTIHNIGRIDYHFYQLEGWDNRIQIENVQNLEDGLWFHVFRSDFRYFRRTSRYGNFGLRARFGISTNIETPFAPFVLDSQVNIRGAGNRRDRGTGAAVLNLEYRQTVFDKKDGNFAAQIVGFSDIGTWRSPGGDLEELLEDESLQFFAGGGIRLIYKKAFNAILRIDYGVDIYNRKDKGFVIGAGQYF